MRSGRFHCPFGLVTREYENGFGIAYNAECKPYECACSVNATEVGEDGKYHIVGRKCGLVPGLDSYVPSDERP